MVLPAACHSTHDQQSATQAGCLTVPVPVSMHGVLGIMASLCCMMVHDCCQTLVDAFGEHRPEVAGLAAPLHRGLALSLTLAAASLREVEAAQRYVSHMLGAVTRELSGLAGETVTSDALGTGRVWQPGNSTLDIRQACESSC